MLSTTKFLGASLSSIDSSCRLPLPVRLSPVCTPCRWLVLDLDRDDNSAANTSHLLIELPAPSESSPPASTPKHAPEREDSPMPAVGRYPAAADAAIRRGCAAHDPHELGVGCAHSPFQGRGPVAGGDCGDKIPHALAKQQRAERAWKCQAHALPPVPLL
jgi:hypothetical protein